MAHRRAVLVALLLAAGLARAATQGPPVYAYTGAAPSGACTGTRVWIDALGTGTYYCNAGTWAAVTAGGGGAPTTAQYWTGAADGTLSAEKNLGALATGLVLNTAGTPSAYGGANCTLPQLMQNLSASGAPTCFQLRLDQVANPTGDSSVTFPSGAKALWTFTGSTDSAFSIHGDGAFTGTGDLVHINKTGTGAAVGSDALHVEVTSDTTMRGVNIEMVNATRTALTTNAVINGATLTLTNPLGAAFGGGGAALPTCAGTDKLTANGTSWSCATDQTGGGGSVDLRGIPTVFGGF